MQMIDVLKRLAELDAKNPNIVKENAPVQECGPMGMMDGMPGMPGHMVPEKPSIPANFSINATAATGNEVADMMSQILTLAGMKQVGADDLGSEPQGALVTAEPTMSVGPMAAEPMPTAADSMRNVLDKLNPEPADDEGGEEGDGLGAFQHDSQPSGDDSDDGNDEGGEENPFAADASSDDEEGEEDDEEGEEETDEGQYDNSPADPNSAPPANADEYAHHENQPGSGETSNGEKRQSNLPTATFEALMKEYKQFIGESEEEAEVEEGKKPDFLDLDDDGNKKEPMKKAAKEVDEGTCPSCHKDPCSCETNESLDILKLAGLK